MLRKKNLLPRLSALLLGLLLAAPASARTPEEQGLAIAREMQARDQGFGDYRAELEMILANRNGDESRRELSMRVLEQDSDGDKSLTVFRHPRDVEGTALLSYAHKTQDDDQWLYLPALKRVKRISASNQSGSFMGSEFAYEDMTAQELEKFSYLWLRDETVDGIEYFVLERRPTYSGSGYTRQVVWVDKEHYRTHKVEYYDRKDSLLKTLTFQGYQQYLERYWRPAVMDMVNHQSGKRTRLNWRDYQFQTGLSDGDFAVNSLSRIR